jgi:hypothetical protein
MPDMKETETFSPSPDQLLQLLDSQIAMKRMQNQAARRNRAIFLTIGVLVIVLGATAALLVLIQMVDEVPTPRRTVGAEAQG